MHDFLLAVLAALPFAAVCFFALPALGIEKAIANQLALVLLTGGIPYIHRTLEKTRHKRKREVPSPEGYGLPLIVVLLLFVFGCLAVSRISGGLIGVGVWMAASTGAGEVMPTQQLLLTAWPLRFATLIAALFLMGRWVGRRSRGMPALGVALSVLLFGVLDWGLTLRLMRPENLPPTALDPMAALVDVLPLLICALIGVWRGLKTRLQFYVAYAMELLPPGDRHALVGLVFEEARRQLHTPREGKAG